MAHETRREIKMRPPSALRPQDVDCRENDSMAGYDIQAAIDAFQFSVFYPGLGGLASVHLR